jgi:hypothetical protein
MEDLAMTGHIPQLHGVDKIGVYLGCDPALLDQALAWQQHWADRGLRKRLGELLLELQLMSPDTLWAALCAQRLDRLRQCTVFAGLDPIDGRTSRKHAGGGSRERSRDQRGGGEDLGG